MKISVAARHFDATEATKAYARDKLGKNDRYFNGVQHVEIVLKQEDRKYHCEAIVHVRNHDALVVDVARDDLHEAIDLAADKCARQLRRMKEKLTGRRRESTAIANPEATDNAE